MTLFTIIFKLFIMHFLHNNKKVYVYVNLNPPNKCLQREGKILAPSMSKVHTIPTPYKIPRSAYF